MKENNNPVTYNIIMTRKCHTNDKYQESIGNEEYDTNRYDELLAYFNNKLNNTSDPDEQERRKKQISLLNDIIISNTAKKSQQTK